MSPLTLLVIFIAPVWGQLILQLGPTHADEDTRSNVERVALPGGIMMVKRMPVRLSRPQSPVEQMVNQMVNGMQDEDDEMSPERMIQGLMLNGLQAGNLLRRSRLGFSRPPQDDVFQKLWAGSFDSDDFFSRPSISSSSFSRTHTMSDVDGLVRLQQTQCRDGMCVTRKSSQPSVNPFAKMKALRAPPPQAPTQDDQYVPAALPRERHENTAPEIVVKELVSPKAEEDAKVAAPEMKKREVFANKELSDFASMLEKGFKAAAAQSTKAADTVKEGLKQSIAAVADTMKTEHVMEV